MEVEHDERVTLLHMMRPMSRAEVIQLLKPEVALDFLAGISDQHRATTLECSTPAEMAEALHMMSEGMRFATLMAMQPEARAVALEVLPVQERASALASMSFDQKEETALGEESLHSLELMSPPDRAEALALHDPERRNLLAHLIQPNERASALRRMDSATKEAVFEALSEMDLQATVAAEEVLAELESMSPNERGWAMRQMSPPSRTGWLHNLPPEERASALSSLTPAESRRFRESLSEVDRAATEVAMVRQEELVAMTSGDRAKSILAEEFGEQVHLLHNMPANYRAATLLVMTDKHEKRLLGAMSDSDREATAKAERLEEDLEEMDPAHRVAALEAMAKADRAAMLHNLPPEYRASALANMSRDERKQTLAAMSEPDRATTREVNLIFNPCSTPHARIDSTPD